MRNRLGAGNWKMSRHRTANRAKIDSIVARTATSG